jgi:hypothetical protein
LLLLLSPYSKRLILFKILLIFGLGLREFKKDPTVLMNAKLKRDGQTVPIEGVF